MNGRRIVITGASGFTGRHACAHFAALGYEVVAAVRQPGSLRLAAGTAGFRVTEAVCRLDHPDEVERLLADYRPHDLLHLAGLGEVAVSWREPMAFIDTNVMGTLRLLDSLKRHGDGGSRALIVGSMLGMAWGQGAGEASPPHPYGMSKAAQVLLARWWGSLFGQSVMIGQPSNLIGPGRPQASAACWPSGSREPKPGYASRSSGSLRRQRHAILLMCAMRCAHTRSFFAGGGPARYMASAQATAARSVKSPSGCWSGPPCRCVWRSAMLKRRLPPRWICGRFGRLAGSRPLLLRNPSKTFWLITGMKFRKGLDDASVGFHHHTIL
ncbi:NAD-dependent epimerase/dehydratase family protein [Paenibacillus sp. TAB 01]|uniref:NAD-dependent epimerase/dehydratase family protein n=1 Tax=Paenibacillus sp. TAB 01 TaxID=3368988 RepID=UPI003750AFE8